MTGFSATPAGFDNALMTLRGAPPATKPSSQQNVAAAAKEFEAVFVSEMLSHMFEGVETDPVFGGGKGEEIFRGMMVGEYGKMIAGKGGIGVADQVMAKMIEMQSIADKGA